MSLINLEINLNNSSYKIIDGNYEEINDLYNNKVVIFARYNEIKKIYAFLKKKKINFFNDIEKIIIDLPFTCTILISNKKFIKICTSIYHPTLRIFNLKNKIVITENEFLEKKNLSTTKAFVKLLSHHGFFFHTGLSNNSNDFLTPASSLIYNKYNKDYLSDWYLDFNNFCTNSDHEKNVCEISENFIETMSNYNDNNNFLSLSGGVDSALTLAASVKANLDIKTTHISDPTYDDETSTAKNVSNFFGKKIKIFYNYTGSKYKIFNYNTDISNLISLIDKEMKGDSVKFPICNSIINLKNNLKNEIGYIHDGNSFPTTLTIRHWFNYPNRKNKNFDYQQNSNLRFYDSKYFFEKKLKQRNVINNWGLEKKFPNIDPYYWSVLDCLYTGNNFHADHPKHDLKTYFPLINNIKNNNLFMQTLNNRGDLIIDKIYNSKFFKNRLSKKNSNTSEILMKFIVFLNESSKIMHQNYSYSDKNIIINTPGLNSKNLLKFLSIRIDNKLVKSAKWHIFESFKKISNTSFENLFMFETLFNPNFLIKRSYQKIFNKFNNLIEFNHTYTFINNKFFKDYLNKKKYLEKYEYFKNDMKHIELPDMPNDEQLRDKKKVNENWWLLNNLINIFSKYEL